MIITNYFSEVIHVIIIIITNSIICGIFTIGNERIIFLSIFIYFYNYFLIYFQHIIVDKLMLLIFIKITIFYKKYLVFIYCFFCLFFIRIHYK